MRVLLAGGGTGGHIYPALAIARALQERVERAEFLFVGTPRGLERELIPREGFRLRLIQARPLPRRLSLALLGAGVAAAGALVEAVGLVREFKPDVVVGTGGYAAGPVVLAALLLRRPAVLQEQNALPGLTTRLLAAWVDRVFLGYGEAQARLPRRARTRVTGNPIRPHLLRVRREEGLAALGLEGNRFTVIVFGASQGAHRINQAVLAAAEELGHTPGLQVLALTGHKEYAQMAEELRRRGGAEQGEDWVRWGHLHLRPYLYEMGQGLAAADLVVGRAGALSLAEITAFGLPAILIPLPTAAEGHQDHNARVLEQEGAAVRIPDGELTGRRLWEAVLSLMRDEPRRRRMAAASRRLGRPRAGEEIAEEIVRLVAERRRRGGGAEGGSKRS
ncbi:MAG: undecaprenyldiphospho-muramoylpentapeptide beta-N-acetylglucosaminyltransferase [Bacillota bacterium]|nr:undecaprenyldiphospho-muramoylpentapeptide beta-N-acetylglucosaminyltransferase [Bacillota bacterium]